MGLKIMKIYEDLTSALHSILRDWSLGYTNWVEPFLIPDDKVNGLIQKWTDAYGTLLPAHTRRYRLSKGLPVALAYAFPFPMMPGKLCVVLLCRFPEKMNLDPRSPFLSEKWNKSLLKIGDYILSHEEGTDKKIRWTWKLQDRPFGIWQQHMTALVREGNADKVRAEAQHAVAYWPMFGGVRRQLRRSFMSNAKLWKAMHKTDWVGPDANSLPIMSFKPRKKKKQEAGE
jgi:hypothetical protein